MIIVYTQIRKEDKAAEEAKKAGEAAKPINNAWIELNEDLLTKTTKQFYILTRIASFQTREFPHKRDSVSYRKRKRTFLLFVSQRDILFRPWGTRGFESLQIWF